ncbi:MAG: dihydroneopterin aldolase [Bacteroidales bacterium]
MGKIFLEDMEFFGYHGCFEEEQIIGNRFLVNLELETNTALAEASDHLADTVNYQAVYMLVGEQIREKSHLLEHLARRVMDALGKAFPEITHMKLKISKMNPPMGGKMRSVSVELER